MTLFTSDDALVALKELQQNGATIYGSDSFLIPIDDTIAPVGVVDVSPGGTTDAFYEPVRQFVIEQPDHCHFELVWD